ncbi:MAG: PEP-CTERM sorting domain-containing protein [Planctomycetota bacterium]
MACPMVFTAAAAHGEIVFRDTFDTSLSSGVETDLNFEVAASGRQFGTLSTSTYTEPALSGAGAFLNVPGGGAFAGQDFLLLRTNYSSASSRASAAALDVNLAPSVEGVEYVISFDGLIQAGSTPTSAPSTDRWMSLVLSGSPAAAGSIGAPNAGATDLGLLIRDNGRLTVWGDGAVLENIIVSGTTGVTLNEIYSLELTIDETGAVPEANISFNNGAYTLGPIEFDFEPGDAGLRGIAMRGNQGAAGGVGGGALADFRYDNLQVEVIPEPGTLGLAGLGLVCLAARRRR